MQWCSRVVNERWFNTTTALLILINALVLGIETYPRAVADFGPILTIIDSACLAYFIMELAIRVIAHGRRPGDFLRNPWNLFDLGVILLTVMPGIRENATMLRLVRLARVLRVVRVFPTMRIIMVAVWRSLPGTASLAVVGVVMLYLYGMVGWTLFGEDIPDKYGSIGRAILTLFCLMLMDGLSESIEQGLMISPWTLPYFVSFILLGGFLLVNILLGVVLNSLDEARRLEADEREPDQPAEASIPDRIATLRTTIDELERELLTPRR